MYVQGFKQWKLSFIGIHLTAQCTALSVRRKVGDWEDDTCTVPRCVSASVRHKYFTLTVLALFKYKN